VNYIFRDLFAGLTLASISIPMSLSYAAYSLPSPADERNLAKIRPINGLYATIAAPLVYAILGKTRRLAVLPEAALSLVVGEAIRQNIGKEGGHPHIGKSSDMASLITFLAALITFFAGMFRLGFVDIIGSPVRPRSI
jgi:MFS superfamily sulfate permease-like transporter